MEVPVNYTSQAKCENLHHVQMQEGEKDDYKCFGYAAR